ncbi:hypothetical protein [Phytomonospora endophytica]|uniref:Uncharacterized protein n=1 Tax=Phytomonospora endophytica TaxID=714109 RepID=A0A841G0A8_9ACTN|nr:hypothetical protein [Phytomonospora endophytica]MBB6037600.1 hypothetical protein [Phytomonospora endophytica]GIG67874.1 hypothetical protein Pen01_41690 [Phytomonospora endophytica]
MPGPNLHRHVAVYKGYIAGGGFSYVLMSVAVLCLLLAWLFGAGVVGWVVALLIAAGATLASGLRRRAVVRMDLYTVRIRNVLLPGAGRRVPVRSIRTVRIIETTPHAADLLRWLPGARRSVLLRNGPAVELELTTGASEILGLDEPYEASRTLRRFHAETTGKELPEDVLDDDEAFYLWRRNRAAGGRAGGRAGVSVRGGGKVPRQSGGRQGAAGKQASARQNAAKQNAAKQAAGKQNAAKQAAAKQNAARQNAAKADVARRAAQQARQQAQRRK